MEAMQSSSPPPSRSSLLSWGLPALGAAVIGGMWLALAQLMTSEHDRIAADALLRSRGLARAYAEYTERKLDQIDQLARFVAHARQRYGTDDDLRTLVQQQLSSNPGLVSVSVADTNGTIVASSSTQPSAGVGDRDYFRAQAASDDDNLFITEVLTSRRTHKPVVVLSRRINNAEGGFAGAVIAAADPAYFATFYDATTFGAQGVASLVGMDGKIRVRRSGDQVDYGGVLPDGFVMGNVGLRAEGAARFDGSSFDYRPRYLAYHKLPDYPMLVIAALDEGEVMGAHRERRDRLVLVFSGISLVLAAAFAGLALLVRQLRSTRNDARAARANFEAASDASLDAFLILHAVRDAQGGIVDLLYVHCNDRAARLLRRDKATIIGSTRTVVRDGQADERFTALCMQVVESRQPAEADLFTRLFPDDPGRWLHHQAVPVDDGVAVTTRDISAARLQAEEAAANRAALQQREQMLHDIADNMPALVAHLDRELRYTFVNAAVRATYGTDELVGQSMRAVRGEAEFAQVEPYFARALAGEAVTFERSGREAAGTGDHIYQANLIPDMDPDGQVRGVYAMTFDVTELSQARAALSTQEKRLRDIADNLPALISYVDADERWGFANETYRTWLGMDPLAMVGHPVADTLGEELYGGRRPWVRRALAGERVEFEHEIRTVGGLRITRTTYVPDAGPDGRVLGIYALSVDVTELKQAQQRLTDLARVDMLTALPNRLALGEALPRALARAARAGQPLALLFLDIDNFKAINDTFGHAGGDSVLVEFSQRLRRAVRANDTVARLAGDEFVVILENIADRDSACAIAGKINVLVADTPFPVDGRPLEVSTSIGIAWHPATLPSTTAADLLARADAALYGAKAAGRNRFQFEA